MIEKQNVVRDRKYLDSFRWGTCWACGRGGDDSVVGAHIRWNEDAGIGRKPSDDLTIPLCGECHGLQEANPGPEFWATLIKIMARRRYRKWKNDNAET